MLFPSALRAARLSLRVLSTTAARVSVAQLPALRVPIYRVSAIRLATTTAKKTAAKPSASKKPAKKAKKTVKKAVKKAKKPAAKKKPKKKPAVLPVWPTRPRSALALFFSDYVKDKEEKKPIGEALANAKAAFDALPSTVAADYTRAALDDKQRYNDEVDDLYVTHGLSVVSKIRAKKNQKLRELGEKRDKKPGKHHSKYIHPDYPTRPPSAYGFFLKDVQRTNPYVPGTPISERGKAIGEAWRALPEERVQHYKELAKQASVVFQSELKEFKAKYTA